MSALFEKDIRLVFLRKSALAIFLVIGVIFAWSFSDSFGGAYITMLGAVLAISTLSYDDSDHCMEFIFTLPCTKKQYVIEKYLFVYGVSFVSGLVGIVIIVVASAFKGTPVNLNMLLEIFVSEIPILVMIGGIMIPLQLKFGPEKTRIVLIALFGIVFILGFAVSQIPKSITLITNIENTLNTINPFGVAFLAAIILVLIIIFSVMISIRVMERREL